MADAPKRRQRKQKKIATGALSIGGGTAVTAKLGFTAEGPAAEQFAEAQKLARDTQARQQHGRDKANQERRSKTAALKNELRAIADAVRTPTMNESAVARAVEKEIVRRRKRGEWPHKYKPVDWIAYIRLHVLRK